jgi:hypothetical protein
MIGSGVGKSGSPISMWIMERPCASSPREQRHHMERLDFRHPPRKPRGSWPPV